MALGEEAPRGAGPGGGGGRFAGLGPALVATTCAQALATLTVFLLPILAPVAAASLGVGPTLVGAQVAIIYTAASFASAWSGEALARLGAARATQLAMACGAGGSAAIASGHLLGVAFGSLLIGAGYGLTNPAATQVLTRLAPAARRNLVFSLKQMGVPIGGALAGLLLPSAALLLGWRGAALGVALALALAALALRPFRAAWDAGPVQAGGGGAKVGALQVLRGSPALASLAAMGALFSAVQLSLGAYAVTMLVGEFGWGAVAAGAAAAAIQASGAVARLVWAMVADLSRAGLLMLAAIGCGTAAAALAMPLALGWAELAVMLLLCAFGACSAGWTGVAMAEVARLAPPGAAGVATGGVLSVTFVGVVVGPLLFAGVVTLLGSYAAGFAVVAALPLLGAALAFRAHRGLRRRAAG